MGHHPDEPSVLAWDLVDGAYRLAARATGDETFTVDAPFPVRFTPASLLA